MLDDAPWFVTPVEFAASVNDGSGGTSPPADYEEHLLGASRSWQLFPSAGAAFTKLLRLKGRILRGRSRGGPSSVVRGTKQIPDVERGP